MELIAMRRFLARRPTGEEFEIELGVGRPYLRGQHDWACRVVLSGLYNRLADARGLDSWQALMLAQRLARDLLEGFIEDGGVLLDADDRQPVRVDAIFRDGTARALPRHVHVPDPPSET